MVLRVCAPSGVESLLVYNIRNYGTSASNLSMVERTPKSDMDVVKGRQVDSSLTLAVVNFALDMRPGSTWTFHKFLRIFLDLLGLRPPDGRGCLISYGYQVSSTQPFLCCHQHLNILTRMVLFVDRPVLSLLAHEAGVVRDPIFSDATEISDTHPRF